MFSAILANGARHLLKLPPSCPDTNNLLGDSLSLPLLGLRHLLMNLKKIYTKFDLHKILWISIKRGTRV